jgi:predicted nucleic acid-binding protein
VAEGTDQLRRLGCCLGRQGRIGLVGERDLTRFLPLTIDDPHLHEWGRLRNAARAKGIAIGDNDLWIAATASVRESVLLTCDRDQVRIARDLPVEVVYLQPPV